MEEIKIQPPQSQPDKIKKPKSTHLKGLMLPVFIIALLGGLIGGALGIFFVNDYFSLSRDRSRQVVLEESSAIIEVANKLKPSVVSIVTESPELDYFGQISGTESSAGTGIIIREDGLILTNKHVIPASSSKITVVSSDGQEYEASVLARDPFNDIAYVKIAGNGFTPAELGDSDQVVVGQKVVAIGNALGEFDNTVTSGIISGIGRPVVAGDATSEVERLQDLFQTDAAINPGNSGGPLVDINGMVIGMNTAIADNAENIGFAIPINQAKAGIASVEKTGKLIKPYLGVRYVSINKEYAKANDLPAEQGAYVIGSDGQPAIIAGSPAAKAGLKEKDVITRVNGQDVTKTSSLVTLVGKYQVGDEITLTVLRDGRPQEIKVKLEELPAS